MTAKPKTVGILGGMGPYATSAFFQTLLTLTPAAKDWDHLHIIIDNNPKIPSRTRHILYGETSPFDGMLASCRQLEKYPVDLIAVPCNSAAIFIPQLQAQLRIPLLNIIEIASGALAREHPRVKRVAVFGGHVTHHLRTYRPALQAFGMELVEHGSEIQTEVEQLIESLKLGRASPVHVAALRDLLARVETRYGAEAAISACTEFGCIPRPDCPVPLIDSSCELARYVVAVARA